MVEASDAMARRRLTLIVVTLATLPCYCIGWLALALAPDSNPATPTPAVVFTSTVGPTATGTLQIPAQSATPIIITETTTNTPTSTPTPTHTATHTVSPTAFQPVTNTPFPTFTPSRTPTLTASATFTSTFIPTITFTPTSSFTPPPTPTSTSTPGAPTSTSTPSLTPFPSP